MPKNLLPFDRTYCNREKNTEQKKKGCTYTNEEQDWLVIRIHANILYSILVINLRFGNGCLANRARVLARKPLFDAIPVISMTAF